jgi:hypothetical protein
MRLTRKQQLDKQLTRMTALYDKHNAKLSAETDPRRYRLTEMVVNDLVKRCLRLYYKIYNEVDAG